MDFVCRTLVCSSSALPGGQVHVLFGYNGKSEQEDHYIFDLASSRWSRVRVADAITPTARSVTDVVYLGSLGAQGSLLVYGGEFTPSVNGHEGAGMSFLSFHF
jgi:hypothetical protein